MKGQSFYIMFVVLTFICQHLKIYLIQSFDVGMAFPAFSDYQDAFASPLTPATFATYIVPAWIPPPATLLRIARTIYPYWKERRTERGGHRIIPTLNVCYPHIPHKVC